MTPDRKNAPFMRSFWNRSFVAIVCLGWVALLSACSPADMGSSNDDSKKNGKADWPGSEATKSQEKSVALLMDSLKDQPDQLLDFLTAMPKGADLHNHAVGAVSPESLIIWGDQDYKCVNKTDFAVAQKCSSDTIPLKGLSQGSETYDQVVGAWSMEGWMDAELKERHQHFFDSFNKFGPITWTRNADLVVEAKRIAASENIQYLELMVGLGASSAGKLADKLLPQDAIWDQDAVESFQATLTNDASFIGKLGDAAKTLDDWEQKANTMLACDMAQPEPACEVEVRYIIQASRTQSRAYVFGQFAYAFELMQIEPRVVGVNLVQAEEDANSLKYYDDEMLAVGLLKERYRDATPVHLALHAGELVPQLLPPDAQKVLGTHIRKAVEIGRADRIGHGVDLMQDPDPAGLLEKMAEQQVLVELCLTSNLALLGVTSDDHPAAAYVGAFVPAAIATDDEGILRTNLSKEFLRAAAAHRLGYAELKSIARNSLEFSFLPGKALRFEPVCETSLLDKKPDPVCQEFLQQNPRAQNQWKLEERFDAFERDQLTKNANKTIR